jgi:hypothetical protein
MTTIVTQIEDATDIDTAHEISRLLLQATHDVYNEVGKVKDNNPYEHLMNIRNIVARCHYAVDKLMGVPNGEVDREEDYIASLKTPLD